MFKALPTSNKIMDKVWADLATEKSKVILTSQHYHVTIQHNLKKSVADIDLKIIAMHWKA